MPTPSLGTGKAPEFDLQALSESLEQPVCLVDGDCQIVCGNRAFTLAFGDGASEASGRYFFDLIDPSGNLPPATSPSLSPSDLCTEDSRHIPAQKFRRKDGTAIGVGCWSHPFTVAGGERRNLIVFDSSCFHQAQDLLAERERKLQRILTGLPDITWTADRQGKDSYISPRVEKVLGYSNHDIYAAPPGFLHSRIHPEDRDRVRNAYTALFREKKIFDEQYRIASKSGDWIWLHDRAVSTHGDDCTPYTDGVFNDVSDRKAAEANLQSKTAFLEALVNSTMDGILVVDQDSQILFANQRMLDLFEIPQSLHHTRHDQSMLEHAVAMVKNHASFLQRVQYLRAPGASWAGHHRVQEWHDPRSRYFPGHRARGQISRTNLGVPRHHGKEVQRGHAPTVVNASVDQRAVRSLATLPTDTANMEYHTVRIEDLATGMILREEIRTTAGMLLVGRAPEITLPSGSAPR
jgi:PAS domain S-box-containing protein